MEVLYVVGSCLTKNTSANMSHNAYVQGLIENGCNVDIIMANNSWGEDDKCLPKWKKAKYYEYNSLSRSAALKNKAKGVIDNKGADNPPQESTDNKSSVSSAFKQHFRSFCKKIFYFFFRPDPVYPLDKVWLKEAVNFESDKMYDIVISNSSPAASHKLVTLLTKKRKIKYKRWIQIWEDPWYFDLYGGYSEKIKNEEHFLLREASEIYYVSPLTLMYQKRYYGDCADKMKFIPLPFFNFNKNQEKVIEDEKVTFGYFGDYYSHTRNLKPFYEALCYCNAGGYIYGDSDLNLQSSDTIEVSGRVTLDKLSEIQNKSRVLVHLCNLTGGQIPGKIYHYSATNKPILFILDGTDDEKRVIKEFFSKYNRYYFCENNKKDIVDAINDLSANADKYVGNSVDQFIPENVVRCLFEC